MKHTLGAHCQDLGQQPLLGFDIFLHWSFGAGKLVYDRSDSGAAIPSHFQKADHMRYNFNLVPVVLHVLIMSSQIRSLYFY